MTEQSEKKNNRLFLLDAYALIFRAYYAFIRNPLVNSKGQNISAVYGFLSSLEEILQRENPTHIAVIFDPPGGSFRNQLYPAYKAHREETPEDIKKSVPLIKQFLEAYRIPVLEIPGFEADDVIGTLAYKAREKGYTTYMVTPDKDFAQLVGEQVFIYKPARSGNEPEIWDSRKVSTHFEVEKPDQVRDILALWGDSADNIPGAPGIGEKTSKKLISAFKDVEGVISNSHQLAGKQRESIEQSAEQIRLAKILVTINTDVPIELEEDKLLIESPDKETLKNLFSDLEIRTLAIKILSRIQNQTTQPGENPVLNAEPSLFQENNKLKDIHSASHQYTLIDTSEKLEILADELKKQKSFCFDTETSGLDLQQSFLVGISVSYKKFQAYYIPSTQDNRAARDWLVPLKAVFENSNIAKIGQNLKFDIQALQTCGIEVKGPLFDTMIAHYLLQPELPHNLDYLAGTYLAYKPVPIEELIGEKGKDQKSMRDVPREKITDYACEDADITLQLKDILEQELAKNGMKGLAERVEMPLVRVLAMMEWHGIRLHQESLEQYAEVLKEEILKTESRIFELAGMSFNISSPKQLGEVLYEKMQIIKDPQKTRTGQYATGEEVLVNLVEKHEIISQILEYRTLTKLSTTYVEALPKIVSESTGRIHARFNQAVTSTGRLSSNNPNLQNIPIREERGREIRKAFIPSDENHVLLSADYSQIELRLMAHMSGDSEMIRAFMDQEDIHTASAAKIFRVKDQEVTREMRNQAKTANFGIIYGISAFGLSQRLRISRTEAKELIDGYFDLYPAVKDYMGKCVQEVRDRGYASTLLGRRRYLPDIHSRNAVVRGFAERNAINTPIQGSAADIIKLAMVHIHAQIEEQNLQTKMIIQVHDELLFDVPLREQEIIKHMVKKEMEHALELQVPLVVEIGTGRNWLEAH